MGPVVEGVVEVWAGAKGLTDIWGPVDIWGSSRGWSCWFISFSARNSFLIIRSRSWRKCSADWELRGRCRTLARKQATRWLLPACDAWVVMMWPRWARDGLGEEDGDCRLRVSVAIGLVRASRPCRELVVVGMTNRRWVTAGYEELQ